MGSRVRKPSKKFQPTPMSPEREFNYRLECLEGESDQLGLVTLDLRKIIPQPDADKYYEASRSVIKGAEQIHARMLIMGLETTPWHELGLNSYDSYCYASYSAIQAALSEVITFTPITEQEGVTP